MFWILITFLITKISDEEIVFFFSPAEGEIEEIARKEEETLSPLNELTIPSSASPHLFGLIE